MSVYYPPVIGFLSERTRCLPEPPTEENCRAPTRGGNSPPKNEGEARWSLLSGLIKWAPLDYTLSFIGFHFFFQTADQANERSVLFFLEGSSFFHADTGPAGVGRHTVSVLLSLRKYLKNQRPFHPRNKRRGLRSFRMESSAVNAETRFVCFRFKRLRCGFLC